MLFANLNEHLGRGTQTPLDPAEAIHGGGSCDVHVCGGRAGVVWHSRRSCVSPQVIFLCIFQFRNET